MMDILDVLLDQDNRDPITLMDDTGRVIDFEQIAVIPFITQYGDRNLYCVLRPIDHIEGIADDEVIVFRVDLDDNGEAIICVEKDESTACSVFRRYCTLLEEERRKRKE